VKASEKEEEERERKQGIHINSKGFYTTSSLVLFSRETRDNYTRKKIYQPIFTTTDLRRGKNWY